MAHTTESVACPKGHWVMIFLTVKLYCFVANCTWCFCSATYLDSSNPCLPLVSTCALDYFFSAKNRSISQKMWTEQHRYLV